MRSGQGRRQRWATGDIIIIIIRGGGDGERGGNKTALLLRRPYKFLSGGSAPCSSCCFATIESRLEYSSRREGGKERLPFSSLLAVLAAHLTIGPAVLRRSYLPTRSITGEYGQCRALCPLPSPLLVVASHHHHHHRMTGQVDPGEQQQRQWLLGWPPGGQQICTVSGWLPPCSSSAHRHLPPSGLCLRRR